MPSQVSRVASMLRHPSHSMHVVHYVYRFPEVVAYWRPYARLLGMTRPPSTPEVSHARVGVLLVAWNEAIVLLYAI
jgi:hypothetical protein